MKKTICILVMLTMLCTAVFGMIGVNAAEKTMDESMIIHWDFEGTDLATQLANKATAGDATDSLVLHTDGSSSVIANGEAKIDSKPSEYLTFITDVANGKGTKIVNNITDGYTIYMRFKISGTYKSTNTPMCANFRSDDKNTALRLWYVPKGLHLRTTTSNKTDMAVADPALFPDEYVAVAITVKKASDGSVSTTLYQTYDDWGELTYSVSCENAADSRSLVGDGFNLLMAGGLWTTIEGGSSEGDMGLDHTYDDIRIYDRILSEDEIKTINVATDNGDEQPGNNEQPGNSDQPGNNEQPGNSEQPGGNDNTNTDTKAPETNAPETETPAEEKGCGGSIGTMALLVPIMGIGAAVIGKRKRR